MSDLIRMQALIDVEPDVQTPVCILNLEADAEPLACAAEARAEHLRTVVGTLRCLRSVDVGMHPHEVVEMLGPVVDDLAVITAALSQKLRHLRVKAAPADQ